MASCYGCVRADVKFAGDYCKECKPVQDITQPSTRGRYMPNAPNERDAITAFICQTRLDAMRAGRDSKYCGALVDIQYMIEAGKHTH